MWKSHFQLIFILDWFYLTSLNLEEKIYAEFYIFDKNQSKRRENICYSKYSGTNR